MSNFLSNNIKSVTLNPILTIRTLIGNDTSSIPFEKHIYGWDIKDCELNQIWKSTSEGETREIWEEQIARVIHKSFMNVVIVVETIEGEEMVKEEFIVISLNH